MRWVGHHHRRRRLQHAASRSSTRKQLNEAPNGLSEGAALEARGVATDDGVIWVDEHGEQRRERSVHCGLEYARLRVGSECCA